MTDTEPLNEPLNDAEADLLLRFESAPSLEKLAAALGRDMTVVSRQLTRISAKGDYLLKVSGRWKLSDLGRRYNLLTQDFRFARLAVLQERKSIRIGASREFIGRVIAPDLAPFRKIFGDADLSLVACEGGLENPLLAGEVDLGLDCGRPLSPEIVYRPEAAEAIIPVAAPAFLKGHPGRGKDFAGLPHIHCERLKADRISAGRIVAAKIAVRTNDIAAARALCIAGEGWALLPKYAVREELERKRLVVLDRREYVERYGVWRLRARATLMPAFDGLADWLKKIRL